MNVLERIVRRHVPDAILSARKISGYTQRELAEKIGVHVNTIAKWESGEVHPDVYKFSDLCAVLNISPNSVLGFDEISEIKSLKRDISILKYRIANAKLALAGHDA